MAKKTRVQCHVVPLDEDCSYMAFTVDVDGLAPPRSLQFMATDPLRKIPQARAFDDLDMVEVTLYSSTVPDAELSVEERLVLLRELWVPEWTTRASRTAQLLAALIEAAADGRPYAVPYVNMSDPYVNMPDEPFTLVFVGEDRWATALGVSLAAARQAAQELSSLQHDPEIRSKYLSTARRWTFNL